MSCVLGSSRPEWERYKPSNIPTKHNLILAVSNPNPQVQLNNLSKKHGVAIKELKKWIKIMNVVPYKRKVHLYLDHTGERHKKYAVDLFGGKCMRCGYNEFLQGLEFHHLDPKQKDKKFQSVRNKSFERIKKELRKCVCLCSNCHHGYHSKKWNIKEIEEKIESNPKF